MSTEIKGAIYGALVTIIVERLGGFIINKIKSKKQDYIIRKDQRLEYINNLNHKTEENNKNLSIFLCTFYGFQSKWGKEYPKSKLRIKMFQDYISLLQSLNGEQMQELLKIREELINMYEQLLKLKNVSKKEKRIYPKGLEIIKAY